MAHGAFQDRDDDMLSEINMIPLIDVMLVLLIVFIVTIPVLKHAVPIELPRASAQPQPAAPEAVRLSVDATGAYFWNDEPLADERELQRRLSAAAAQTPPPPLHLHGHREARYERIAQAMALAQQAGLRQIGFITDPASGQRPASP